MSENLAAEHAANTAVRIERLAEEADHPSNVMDGIEPLEAKVVASLDTTAREVILVLGTGGPHVELNVSNGTVTVQWDGSHTTHVNADDALDHLRQHYLELWRANGGKV